MTRDERIERRRIGDRTLEILREDCIGSASCTDLAGGVLQLGDDGIVTVADPDAQVPAEELQAACEVCPVAALHLYGPDGDRLV